MESKRYFLLKKENLSPEAAKVITAKNTLVAIKPGECQLAQKIDDFPNCIKALVEVFSFQVMESEIIKLKEELKKVTEERDNWQDLYFEVCGKIAPKGDSPQNSS